MAALRALGVDIAIWTMPSEIAGADPVRARPRARRLRRRCRATVLAPAGAGRPRVEHVPRPLPRQVQPRAFLLGQLRPRGHALLRPHRAAAHRATARTSATGSCAKPIRTRSAAAASGRAMAASARRRSTPMPIPSPPVSAKRRCAPPGALQQGRRAVHPALRGGAHRGCAGPGAAAIPAEQLRGLRRQSELGPACVGATADDKIRGVSRALRSMEHAQTSL